MAIDSMSPVTKGVLAANVFGLAVSLATLSFVKLINKGEQIIVLSEFFIVPIAMGMISAYYWNKIPMKGIKYLTYSIANFLAVLVWSIFILMEGYICLLIVSPILLVSLVAGAYLGRFIFKRNKEKLNLSVISILLVIYILDVSMSRGYDAVVRDEIIIDAPAGVVWKHVVSFPEITDKPKFWMFRIGMPMPMETTVEAGSKDAGRECIFNDGIIFVEKMVVFEPEKDLTFDIIEQPQHPEIIGHIVMDKGQFLLEDLGDGRTKLVGSSWYRLMVYPVWYYNTWARAITRNVHLRVMKHIKKLSENENLALQ